MILTIFRAGLKFHRKTADKTHNREELIRRENRKNPAQKKEGDYNVG